MADTTAQAFTAIQIGTAADAAFDLVVGELNLGERDRDLLAITFHAAMEKLTDPGISFDAVIRKHFEDPPQMVRGWWTNWE